MSHDDAVDAAERRIQSVISDVGCSFWLRDAARAALDRDPLNALHDAEILLDLLKPWADAIMYASIEAAFAQVSSFPVQAERS